MFSALTLLTHLDIPHLINDQVLLTISSSLSHLQTLSLAYNQTVTENGLLIALQTSSHSSHSSSLLSSSFTTPLSTSSIFHLTSLNVQQCSMASDSFCSLILKYNCQLQFINISDTDITTRGVVHLLQLPK